MKFLLSLLTTGLLTIGLITTGVMSGTCFAESIYFAGPLFNQAEKDYNLKIANLLEKHGYKVFLPQRDGFEAALLEGKTEEEITKLIFEKDVSEVLKADVLVFNLDGRIPDEGACIELGIAYANGKLMEKGAME